MPITLTNALLLDLDPLEVVHGALRIVGDAISEMGPTVRPADGDEIVDCRGSVVLPGLVNGHTHLYSALAPGMPPPTQPPANFEEILERIWWRLDRALDAETIQMSATIGALDALRCGTTTLIDHHASPDCIPGSLDRVRQGVDAVGLRAVLCYETTDRNGPAGAAAGLEENRRHLETCAAHRDGRFAAMVGAHAAFTLSNESLGQCADLAERFSTGVHLHVAEDPCDDRTCRRHYGAPLTDRLSQSGILDSRRDVAAASILAHGTHLAPQDARRISAQVSAMAHNPASNMNNRVGHAPVSLMSHVLLGTDGIGSNMFTEARHAYFKASDAAAADPESAVVPSEVVAMLAHGARVAGKYLNRTLGRLTPAAAADIVITDYRPATPLDGTNAAAHLLFALGPQHVRHVLVAGLWMLRDREPTRLDEPDARARAQPLARALWNRMDSL